MYKRQLFSNPVEAEDAFNARVDQSDLLLAAVPYYSIVDSTIAVSYTHLDVYKRQGYRCRDLHYL